MLNKLGLYYRTIKHLKPVQIRYRLWYGLRSRFFDSARYLQSSPDAVRSYPLELKEWIPSLAAFKDLTFTFLNQSETFTEPIDWNYPEHGKLWTYHLNYFDYLLQPGMTKETGALLIGEFMENLPENRTGLEPYPISLRGINWIKFLSRHDMYVPEVDTCLYAQYHVLLNNLEYHQMGNHLLENGCSLIFGAWYFRDEQMYDAAKEILLKQLDEQILNDGGHFERSPMYHRILLGRLLDVYNLISCNRKWKTDTELEKLLQEKAQKMLGWIQVASFSNGDVPMVNDSTRGIGPNTRQLLDYAGCLSIRLKQITLYDSGYRMIRWNRFELFADVAPIGPDYLPGHTHSDTLSFILYYDKEPILVDTGTSTYGQGERRQTERSTRSHNTVLAGGEEQSEIWGEFRTGRRAKPVILSEEAKKLSATHTGYDHLGVRHVRTWEWPANKLLISDILKGGEVNEAEAFLHFHPDRNVTEVKSDKNTYLIDNQLVLIITGAESIRKADYLYAEEFNKTRKSTRLIVKFISSVVTEIKIAGDPA